MCHDLQRTSGSMWHANSSCIALPPLLIILKRLVHAVQATALWNTPSIADNLCAMCLTKNAMRYTCMDMSTRTFS